MSDHQVPERNLASWPGLRGKCLHYSLLRHTLDARHSHYDLMLELRPGGGISARTLWGFQRSDLPERGAQRMEWRTHGLHRRRYLSFVGDMGENRGSVERIDRGQYCVAQVGGRLTLEVSGGLLCGRFTLVSSGYGRHVWVRIGSSRPLLALKGVIPVPDPALHILRVKIASDGI
jgi:hypothetical protein